MESEWQPAIILPLEKMCTLHRRLFLTMPLEVQQLRKQTVGNRVEVSRDVDIIYDYSNPEIKINPGECLPLLVRHPVYGKTGLFSCEVSTD